MLCVKWSYSFKWDYRAKKELLPKILTFESIYPDVHAWSCENNMRCKSLHKFLTVLHFIANFQYKQMLLLLLERARFEVQNLYQIYLYRIHLKIFTIREVLIFNFFGITLIEFQQKIHYNVVYAKTLSVSPLVTFLGYILDSLS